MLSELPVGVFDSGVGGLTVAREIFHQLPGERILYFGDTAHVPYGPRPAADLIALADEIVGFMVSRGVKAVVDACNSTSAVALEYLQQKYPVPILGVIEPGVGAALKATVNGRVGVIGTEATINSGAHLKTARGLNPEVKLYSQPCPMFVPLVEQGELDSRHTRQVAGEYLDPLLNAGIDTLIMGCTHYPYLAPVIQEIMGPGVKLIDPALDTVKQLKALLREKGLLNPHKPKQEHQYFVSGEMEAFQQVGAKLLGEYLLGPVSHVKLR
ncbi:MAG: glutamate racemase [Bacillota bacterium]